MSKHDWHYLRDEYAEGRQCTICGCHQYAYANTDGSGLFWLPVAPNYCRRKVV